MNTKKHTSLGLKGHPKRWLTLLIILFLIVIVTIVGVNLWQILREIFQREHHHPNHRPTRSFLSNSIDPSHSGSPSVSVSTSISFTSSPSLSPSFIPVNGDVVRVKNSGNYTIWVEARYGNEGSPLPGYNYTSSRVEPNTFVEYLIPASGLAGARFWAKWGCNDTGGDCRVGQSSQYWPNPPGGCPVGGCTPPVDSLFEATFGCWLKNISQCSINPSSSIPTPLGDATYFDTSQADGFTFPYKLLLEGQTSKCDCNSTGYCNGLTLIDGSQLDLRKCPRDENLSYTAQDGTQYSFVLQDLGNGTTLNRTLGSVDMLMAPVDAQGQFDGGIFLACMSPCKKLNYGFPQGFNQDISAEPTLLMCCPSPLGPNNTCDIANGCVTSPVCNAGPVVDTKYVQVVHVMTNDTVYAFSYDDKVGLHSCPAGTIVYTMEFSPVGSPSYPYYTNETIVSATLFSRDSSLSSQKNRITVVRR